MSFRVTERRVRRRLARLAAADLPEFASYLVERNLHKACYLRGRVRKMHDRTYQRAMDHLLIADSVLSQWNFYCWEKRNATQGQAPVPQANVPGQDNQ